MSNRRKYKGDEKCNDDEKVLIKYGHIHIMYIYVGSGTSCVFRGEVIHELTNTQWTKVQLGHRVPLQS